MGIATWLIPSVVAFGTEEQKQRFLPPTLRGEMIWCQLFSEPGAGSDLASLTTKATKVDGGWRITGQKIWTTAAQLSQWGMLLARTDPSAPKHSGITYFLLDMHSDGVEVKPLRELTGNAMFNTVFIDDVFVPDDLVLGEVNRGWEVSRTSEAPFLANLNGFVEFIRDGHFDQIDQNHAGRLIAEGHAAKVLNMRSTLLTLAGGDPMPAAAISKLLSMRTGQSYAEFAVSSFGTDGAIGDPDQLQGQWAQMLLASRATTIYGGTSEVSTAARLKCSSTSLPSGCWDCLAIRKRTREHCTQGRDRRRITALVAISRKGTKPTTGDVTLRQLRYFAVLGEELNYRRGAERLFITQPALSTAIKQLEHQLGVMLFTRSTREVALTELGEAWLPKVREALRGIETAVDDLIDMSAHYRRIRLGYLIGTGADLLFRLMRHFEATFPEITLEPREFDFSDPTAGLADGTTEVAIIRPPVDLPEHRILILDAEDWVACLPRDHPLAGRSELTIAELLDDPIVVAPATAGRWRDYWMAMDARGGKPPTIAAVAATYEEETTTIARGLGISFTSEASARLYNRQGIAYVPITDRPRNYTALAWHPAGLSREAAQLVQHVREEWSFGEGQAIERPATYY
jgi:DNA-binding transcriptional LysR family regulator